MRDWKGGGWGEEGRAGEGIWGEVGVTSYGYRQEGGGERKGGEVGG